MSTAEVKTTNDQPQGRQRLSVARLDQWRELQYGMFIHYSLATFTSQERGDGVQPIELYNPSALDVDQWVQVARDAGMRYIILSAKHAGDGGFCTWPTKHSDFSVANAPENTDVIGAFVQACAKHGVKPALYIGGEPCDESWTGFQCHDPETGSGYVLIFREVRNHEREWTVPLYFVGDSQLAWLDVLNGESWSGAGALTCRLEPAPAFRWLRYEPF